MKCVRQNQTLAGLRLLGHRDQIKQWLTPGPTEKRGLQLTKVHKLLGRRGVDIPYSTLHRFAVKHCGFSDRRRITVRRAECEPGELAEVDFGKLGLIPNPETGRRRTAWALIVTLGYSRHQYVHVTFLQKIPHVIEGVEDAWSFFGGCARRVVVEYMTGHIFDIELNRCAVEPAGAFLSRERHAGTSPACNPPRA